MPHSPPFTQRWPLLAKLIINFAFTAPLGANLHPVCGGQWGIGIGIGIGKGTWIGGGTAIVGVIGFRCLGLAEPFSGPRAVISFGISIRRQIMLKIIRRTPRQMHGSMGGWMEPSTGGVSTFRADLHKAKRQKEDSHLTTADNLLAETSIDSSIASCWLVFVVHESSDLIS